MRNPIFTKNGQAKKKSNFAKNVSLILPMSDLVDWQIQVQVDPKHEEWRDFLNEESSNLDRRAGLKGEAGGSAGRDGRMRSTWSWECGKFQNSKLTGPKLEQWSFQDCHMHIGFGSHKIEMASTAITRNVWSGWLYPQHSDQCFPHAVGLNVTLPRHSNDMIVR